MHPLVCMTRGYGLQYHICRPEIVVSAELFLANRQALHAISSGDSGQRLCCLMLYTAMLSQSTWTGCTLNNRAHGQQLMHHLHTLSRVVHP